MRLPRLRGVIERRMLVNYRVEPEVLARQLPAPFEPKLHNGKALVGICLIRLRGVRPRFVPEGLGIRSENAAHRAAVFGRMRRAYGRRASMCDAAIPILG